VLNTRLGLVVKVRSGLVVRSMPLGSPLGEASPKTLQNMVEQFLWTFIVCDVGSAYGGVLWCPRMVPSRGESSYPLGSALAILTVGPNRRLRCAKAWSVNRLGTSKSAAIFNPLATTPIHVRYRRHLHHYKRLLSAFLTVPITPNLGVVGVDL
jgi:hypothetical protein